MRTRGREAAAWLSRHSCSSAGSNRSHGKPRSSVRETAESGRDWELGSDTLGGVCLDSAGLSPFYDASAMRTMNLASQARTRRGIDALRVQSTYAAPD